MVGGDEGWAEEGEDEEDYNKSKSKSNKTIDEGKRTVKVRPYKKEDNGKFLLGGYYEKVNYNLIPSSLNYSYAKFPRKTTLQKPDNYCLMFRSPDAERIFQRLWNDGDFKVEVQFQLMEEENFSNDYFTWGLLPFEDDDINLLGSTDQRFIMSKKYFLVETNPGSIEMTEDYIAPPTMKSIFTQRQLEALLTRITHRLFRECASIIPEFWRAMILEALDADCRNRGYWDDLLDIRMIWADTSFHLGSPQWSVRLFEVAGALQAKGKFDLAAQIYEDLLNVMKYPEDFPTLPPMKNPNDFDMTLRLKLGCVHTYNNNWDSSLKVFVEAMHLDYRHKSGEELVWDLSNSETRLLINRFHLMLYHFARGGGNKAANLYLGLFSGLLFRAGYKLADSKKELFRLCDRLIKPNIQKNTTHHLCLVFGSPRVQDFQYNLIKCRDPSTWRMQLRIPEDANYHRERKKHHKYHARTSQAECLITLIKLNSPECDNPLCQEEELERSMLHDCSECHNVQYCSKQCQVQHWPAHKRECRRWCKFYHLTSILKREEQEKMNHS